MREVSLKYKGRGSWRNMNTDGRRVLAPRPKDQDKDKCVTSRDQNKIIFIATTLYEVYHFWTNFLRVQSLSLCSLANVSCMPNSSFCRWQQATCLLIYIVRESRLKKFYDLFVIIFDTFKFSSFTCIWICESNNLYSGEMSDKLLYFLKEFRFLTSPLHSNSLFRGDHFNVVITYRMSFVICSWHPPQKFRSRKVYLG